MRNLLVLLAGLAVGSTCYAQTTNNFTTSGDATVGNGSGIRFVNPDGRLGAKLWGNNSSFEGNTSTGCLQLNGSFIFDNGNYLNLSDGASVVNIHQNTAGSPITIKLNAAGDSYFNGGRFGIGTTNVDARLVVAGSGTVQNITNLTDQDIRFNLTAPNAIDKFALIGPSTPTNLAFGVGNVEKMRILNNGNVGIGTTDPKGYRLAVAGKMVAEEVNVKLQSAWPDFVFKRTYKLPSLTEVKEYIDKNKHLPDMPSEQEVAKEGISLGEMNRILVKKMEEMTLYMIEKDKQLTKQQTELDKLKKVIKRHIKQ